VSKVKACIKILVEVEKMSDIRHLIRDIQRLIKAIRQEALILRKDIITIFRIRYVLDGTEDEVVYYTSDTEEAAKRFLAEVLNRALNEKIASNKITVEDAEKVKTIVENIISTGGSTGFKIERAKGIKATNEWAPVRLGPENVHLYDKGVFEVDGTDYEVEKDINVHLQKEDIKILVKVGLTSLSVDAVKEKYETSAEAADDWWDQVGKWKEEGRQP
jgi:hypothetical protein